MNDKPLQHDIDDTHVVPDISATEQVSVLLDDIRALVNAELLHYRSRLDYTRHVMRWAFRYGAITAFAFSGAAIALVMGLVLTLSPQIGPLFATLVVTLGFTIIGAIFGVQARKWWRKVYFPEIQKSDDDIT